MPCTIVALGPDDANLLTLQAAETLKAAEAVLLRTGRHGAASWLEKNGVVFETLDALYDGAEDFDAFSRAAADAVQRFAALHPRGAYAVPDPAGDETVAELARRNMKMTVLCGVTQADCACASALENGFPAGESVKAMPASALRVEDIDPSRPLVLTEINSRLQAGECKLCLLEVYAPETDVLLDARRVKLEELDRQTRYDHLTRVYVPASPMAERTRFTFGDLLDVMARLRRRGDGCPWDLEQTHESLRQYLIEEAHEAVAAINSGDSDRMADELGDVLLQVVFHAQVGKEHGEFAITDVTSAICAKMIARHRHIFGDLRCATAAEVLTSWEQIKKKEKGLKLTSDVMRDVPESLPALMRASKVQNKAHQIGFDWDDPRCALDKIGEETGEVREELDAGRDPEGEFGDLLFAAAHACRLCGVQPELALDGATEKFIRRFEAMEAFTQREEKALPGMTLAEMEGYWARAKQAEKEERP